MRIVKLLVLLFLSCPGKEVIAEELVFKKHTFELTLATGLDHQFIVGQITGNSDDVEYLRNRERPFVGFSIGLQYIYRPLKFFGISAGLENLEFGSRPGRRYDVHITDNGTTIIKRYSFDGSIGVPVYLRFYKALDKVEMEFTTGPEFFFPVFSVIKNHASSTNVAFIPYDLYSKTSYPGAWALKNFSLAWTAQFAVHIPVAKAFSIAIGPEWKFLDLAEPRSGEKINQYPRAVPFFLGLKIGLRLGTNIKRVTRPAVK